MHISSLPPFNLYIEVQGGKLAVVSWEPPNIGRIRVYCIFPACHPSNLYIEVQGGKLAVVSLEPPNIGKISGYFQLATLQPLEIHGGKLAVVSWEPPNQGFRSGSGSRRAKMTHKNIQKVQNFHVFKFWMFSFEG